MGFVSQIMITVGVLAGTGTLLAILLEIAGKLFANYGQVQLDINQGARQIEVPGGGPLVFALRDQKIFIPSACGGRGSCGECKLRVTGGGGPVLPTEEPLLSPEELKSHYRISCQLKVRNDLSIVVPEELFAIRSWMTRLAQKRRMTYDILELRLELPPGEPIDFKPGQYIQVKSVPYGKVKESVMRAYSISSPASDEQAVEIIVRKVPDGICTTWIHDHLEEGSPIEITGPYGDFYLRESDRDILMIAGGSGLAPMKSILHQMKEQQIQRHCVFVFGAVDLPDLYHLDAMKDFEQSIPDFTFVPTLSGLSGENRDKWTGETGLVTEVVEKRFGDKLDNAEGYLCGSPGMIDACVKLLTSLGIPEDRIYYDKFA